MNAYLREITGTDITAKDFRTWAGTVLAAVALLELEHFDSQAQAKRNLRAALERVSTRLGNTPTICRKCYVHPEVLSSYLDGNLALRIEPKTDNGELAGLQPDESAVLALLRARLKHVPTETRRPDLKSNWANARVPGRKPAAAGAAAAPSAS